MNVINYLGWEMCLPRQNSSLRPIEGKQVDQNDLNFIQCWKLRVRFSKLSIRFQLRITFLASWLHPLEHCSDFSYTLAVFSYCETTGKYSNSILFGLSPFLLNIKYFSQNKKLQKLLLCYCPPYHSDSILSILLKVPVTAFIPPAYIPYPVLKILIPRCCSGYERIAFLIY